MREVFKMLVDINWFCLKKCIESVIGPQISYFRCMGTGTRPNGIKIVWWRLLVVLDGPWCFFFLTKRSTDKSLDTVVSRGTMLWTAKFRGARDFSLFHNMQTCFGDHPATTSVSIGFVSRGKAVGAWCWPFPSSAHVKNEWRYTSFPPYAFMTWAGTTLTFMWVLSLSDRRQDDRTSLYRLDCDVLFNTLK